MSPSLICGTGIHSIESLGMPTRMIDALEPASEAEAVVQQQLDAYNARDLDAFMATYADGAEIFEHPSKLLASGAAQIRERYAVRFREPNLHATLLSRIVLGDVVIDHERIVRDFPEGSGTLTMAAIYVVRAGRIGTAWFILGEKTVDRR
jgi:hypothetical protein